MQAGIDIASKELVCYIDSDCKLILVNYHYFEGNNNGADAVIVWRHKRKILFENLYFNFAVN